MNYYIPDISEFHVGFEYEYYEPVTEKWVKTTIDYFDEHISTQNLISDLQLNALRPIRVKCLDEDDILSLGFIPGFGNYRKSVYTRGNICINLNYNLPFIMKDNQIVFTGTIKNKSRLMVLLEQIGI